MRYAILAVAWLLAAVAPWQVLPPMPALPQASVSGPVAVDGIRIWRAEFGPPDGRPVLLLHGGLANANYFGLIIPALAAEGFRVIAMDTRGHGRSTRDTRPFSYDLLAEDVIGLMDALHIARADVVGWSDGGIVGLELAIHHAERIGRVFAFGANTDPSGLIPNFDRAGLFAAFEKRAEGEYDALSPTPGHYKDFLAQISHMWDTQPRISAAQLRGIHVKLVICDGRYDEAIRQSHDRFMAETIPDARLVILPGVSHFAMLQNPPLFARAVLDALTAPWD